MTNRNRLRALVVDDVVDTADSLALLLDLWGYHAKVCYGGIAALEAIRAFRPDVVLLDIGMPGMDGFQVADRIREMPGLPGTVLIGISGYTSETCHVRASGLGFDYYLNKPEDPLHLQALLATALQSSIYRPSDDLRFQERIARSCAREELFSRIESAPRVAGAVAVVL